MEKDLTSLKSGLFKYGGEDLNIFLLKMVNKTKDTFTIPESINIVNIAMIPKPGKHRSTYTHI